MKRFKRRIKLWFTTAVILFAVGLYLDSKGLIPSFIPDTLQFRAGVSALLPILVCILFKLLRGNILRHSTPAQIDKMSGEIFEEWLQYYFNSKGWHSHLTPMSGDFGADLVMKRRGRTAVVQAKRYKGNVGIEAVQQVIGAREYYHTDDAIVATNSYFTKAAKELALKANVQLLDRRALGMPARKKKRS